MAKKARPSTSFRSPEEYQMAIIDRSGPDGRMSSERWLEVENRVLLVIANGAEDGGEDEVSFDGVGWQKGVKVVGCSNKKCMDFLRQVVDGCDKL